jgi:hypothetical protein
MGLSAAVCEYRLARDFMHAHTHTHTRTHARTHTPHRASLHSSRGSRTCSGSARDGPSIRVQWLCPVLRIAFRNNSAATKSNGPGSTQVHYSTALRSCCTGLPFQCTRVECCPGCVFDCTRVVDGRAPRNPYHVYPFATDRLHCRM